MDMNEAVAKAIGAERSIADMTVRELANQSGIPERSLMRILQAERDIKVNQVDQLAEALKLYPHEIIERAEIILERSNRAKPNLTLVSGMTDDELSNIDLSNLDLAATHDNTSVHEQTHNNDEDESQDPEDH